MKSIYGMSLKDLEDYFISLDGKKYRATQIFDWLYRKKVNSFDEMTNIKKEVLDKLKEDFEFRTIELIQVERDELTNKYLFRLFDKEHIEAVLMKHDYGNSICVSSQVGCNMGCKFCESGRRKKVRNLYANEIVEQILEVENDINNKITHVVMMGIGEPFDNYEEITKFIEIINNNLGLGIGARHITVSTCGIVPKIKEFADFPYQVNLAISLHAPNDELRSEIMPIDKAYKLDELMDALKYYYDKTNRRLSFEYVMLEGINDTEECAKELVDLVKGLNCYVNLIPYNETENIGYKRSSNDKIMRFYDILKKNDIDVTKRREFGGNISAACGQLRSKKEEQ